MKSRASSTGTRRSTRRPRGTCRRPVMCPSAACLAAPRRPHPAARSSVPGHLLASRHDRPPGDAPPPRGAPARAKKPPPPARESGLCTRPEMIGTRLEGRNPQRPSPESPKGGYNRRKPANCAPLPVRKRPTARDGSLCGYTIRHLVHARTTFLHGARITRTHQSRRKAEGSGLHTTIDTRRPACARRRGRAVCHAGENPHDRPRPGVGMSAESEPPNARARQSPREGGW